MFSRKINFRHVLHSREHLDYYSFTFCKSDTTVLSHLNYNCIDINNSLVARYSKLPTQLATLR